jgi:hypothetical protein
VALEAVPFLLPTSLFLSLPDLPWLRYCPGPLGDPVGTGGTSFISCLLSFPLIASPWGWAVCGSRRITNQLAGVLVLYPDRNHGRRELSQLSWALGGFL